MTSAQDALLDRARSALAVRAADLSVDVMRVGEDFFGLADVVRTTSALRRALTDPSREAEDKERLADQAFGPHVQEVTRELVHALAREHWSDPMSLYDAYEVLGICSTLEDAKRHGKLVLVERELFAVGQVLSGDAELRNALSDIGAGTRHQRADLAQRIFGPHISRWTMRLVRRGVGRTSHGRLLATLRRFSERAASMRGHTLVTVEAAAPLTDRQVERLSELVRRRVGSDVTVNVAIEPRLMGGFRIRTADLSIDSTVSARVADLRRAFTH